MEIEGDILHRMDASADPAHQARGDHCHLGRTTPRVPDRTHREIIEQPDHAGLFEKRTERREQRAEKIRATPEVEDVSVFPMAMPMIAGPGSIASVMLLVSRNDGLDRAMVIFAALIAVLLMTLVALLAAGPIMRVAGAKTEAVLTRLLGVLLAALAAQFVIDGLKASFPALA